MDYEVYCQETYRELFKIEYESAIKHTSNKENARRAAQRKAIDGTFGRALIEYYNKISEDAIWKAIGQIHKVYFAKLDEYGIDDNSQLDIVNRVVSSHQSWIKAGGHGFERFVPSVLNEQLEKYDICIVLQRELNKLIKQKKLSNTEEDITGLSNWGKDFDLYAIQTIRGKNYVFGCIQSKTSIRDRVGRDLPFSKNAMEGLFWSVAVTLDGDFLNMSEFKNMVNGEGSYQHNGNGWHGMYAMAGISGSKNRVYKVDDKLDLLVEHTVKAGECFISDRRNLNQSWRADL